MKSLSSLLLVFLFSVLYNVTFSQNNNIGFNILSNDVSVLNIEARYEKFIRYRWLIGSGVASNLQNYVTATVGFKYDLLKRTKFSLFTGLDYRYASLNLQKTDFITKQQNSLEVPLEFRYHLSDKMSLNAGFSIPFSLDKGRQDEYLFNNYKIGVIRRF